ncbi:hypothetical protein [Dokdonella soli]|uniref:Uncharacterized protein n=1 Tax=Dokdonella soli TaxID=529810 RepID=A0ABN1IBZ5_9GAMM
MNTHFSEHLVEIMMPTRLTRLLLLAVAIAGTGATIVALSPGSSAARQQVNAAAVAPAPSATATTLLPTVVVHPEAPMPTLATITVRPDRTDAEFTEAARANDHLLGEAVRNAGASVGGVLSSTPFDMPYYSFGKPLRRVSKE